jgi:hypothetical protein
MGDITPPVGLATFAAAAISGEDAIQTGIQGSLYALRTVILPFIWIFNPQLLLIDIDSLPELLVVIAGSTMAMLLFSALTMGWLRVRMRWWEAALVLLSLSLFFRPDWFMDRITPATVQAPAEQVYEVARDAPDGGRLVMVISGTNLEGEDISKTVAVRLGPRPADGTVDGRKRLAEAGLTLVSLAGETQIAQVKFGSRARKSGFEQGYVVQRLELPADRPSPLWFYLPALALAAIPWFTQGRRMRGVAPA